jgi:hypothetical protein
VDAIVGNHTDPGEVAGVVGGDDPADPPDCEPVTERVDEREPFPGRRVLDQGFGRFPQNVGFLAQVP